MTSRVSGSLNASRPPHAMAEKDSKIGTILVIPTNLEKIKVLIMAANLQRPFSTPKAVALQRKEHDGRAQ